MNTFILLQVLDRSMDLAEKDSHGLIVTTVSVSVVFTSLLILLLSYILIGKLIRFIERYQRARAFYNAKRTKKQTARMKPHDLESGIITIRRKGNSVTIPHRQLHISGQTPSGVNSHGGASKTMKTPLPGTITDIKVKTGDRINIGQEVAVLEAMKMENSIESEFCGTVSVIHARKGDTLAEGEPIITLE